MLRSCVLALFVGSLLPLATFAEEDALKLSLQTQAALQQGRKFLAAGECGSAVRVLEAGVAQAQGDAIYLKLLAQAYQGQLKELHREGRTDLAKKVQERLAILEKALPPAIEPTRTAVGAAKPPAGQPAVLVRGQQAEEALIAVEVGRLTGRADELFQAEKYADAGQLYQEAYKQQRELPGLARERWAYCKLHKVTQQLNTQVSASLDFAGLEQETREALTLAPRFEFGQKILETLHAKAGKTTAAVPTATPAPATAVNHLPNQGSWQIAESQNFRLHHQNRQIAEQALAIAEKTRSAVAAKWLGGHFPQPWTSKCDLFIYATGQAYAQATGAPAESPGHSSINANPSDATQVQHRRVDLRGDHAHLLVAVLPHEVTHAVLAGQVGRQPIPRWADEGLAVLSETYERIGRHLAPLPECYTQGRAFSAEQLVNLADYPEPGRMGAFYGQGVCLVQYLTAQKSPPDFIAFLRSAEQTGYESALRQHYGMGLAELNQRLERFIVHERTPGLSVAGR